MHHDRTPLVPQQPLPQPVRLDLGDQDRDPGAGPGDPSYVRGDRAAEGAVLGDEADQRHARIPLGPSRSSVAVCDRFLGVRMTDGDRVHLVAERGGGIQGFTGQHRRVGHRDDHNGSVSVRRLQDAAQAEP